MASRDSSDPALVPTLDATPRDPSTADTDLVSAATATAPRDLAVTLAIGERVGDRYLVRSFLGEGGMGAVYRALDETLGEEVALKVVRTGVGDVLRDEVRLAQKVTHRNVCRTYDLEEAGGHHFVKMEFVEGETLAARIARDGKLAIADAVRIALEIADGLAAAHAKGIVHRDLKPGNIMLSGDRAVLMDFGIAHQIERGAGVTAGTLGYMAPEQITEGTVDGRADTYALGCVLHEMLAGKPLFGAAKRLDLAIRHVSTRPPGIRAVRPEVPRWLARAIRELLSKTPERRDQGIARLRRGRPALLPRAVPVAVGIAALAAIAIVGIARRPSWHPRLTSYQAYEEDSNMTAISPDGQWLVFDSDRADIPQLYVMSRATGETVKLATPPGIGAVTPRWTRDGTSILYAAGLPDGDHVYRQPVSGTPPASIGAPIDLGIGIYPDACGKDAIVYVESTPLTKQVMVLANDGSRQTLATVSHNETLAMPHCDPAGSHVVFVRGIAPNGDPGNDIYVVDRVGATRTLTTDHAASSAVFTADGRSIVMAASHNDKTDLFVMPATGGRARPLGIADATMVTDVSRDGRVVVYHSVERATFPAISTDGKAPRKITSQRGTYFWLRPVGLDRVVARRADGARSEVLTLRIADGAITTLAQGFSAFPSFDNQRVYFRGPDSLSRLMMVPITGGPATFVATLPGAIMHGTDGPDGEHLGIETNPGVIEAYRVVNGKVEAEGAPGLVTVAPTGGWRAVTILFQRSGVDARSRLLLVPPGAPLSAPSKELSVGSIYNMWIDDHRIGYCVEQACHVLDVVTNAVEDVPAYPDFYEHGAIVTPDGKHIVDSLTITRVTRHELLNFEVR